jgi:hexosaminidase
MSIALIPQPHSAKTGKGFFVLPTRGVTGISSNDLYPVADEARALFRRSTVGISVRGKPDTLRIAVRRNIRPGGYQLSIKAGGIVLEAASVAAASHGLHTLFQIKSQCRNGKLPQLTINDWPDFPERGLYYDVTRGRVPKLERLMEQVDILSQHKINQYQLYIEHVFQFRGHPDIGKGASPLSADDILKLDAHCRSRNIELVPSLASFGHLSTILKHKQYHQLAEDWGIGKYLSPEAKKLQTWQRHKGWTLAPANPKVYEFLDSLFAEFLPLFSSDRFNVCCDETWDIGLGQSYHITLKKGKGRLYLDHIIRLRDLAAKYGKRIMFWGDIIHHYPELIKDIPKDVTVLDWGYSFNHNFGRIQAFKKVGLPFFACPGTNSWVALFPRLHEAMHNIHSFAEAARKYGARGVLNTDWGDCGHGNMMETSWHGYLYAAEQAWNMDADRKTYTRRFCKLFLNIDDAAFAKAVEDIGDVSNLIFGRFYQSLWWHIFYAKPGDPVFHQQPDVAFVCRHGRIRKVRMVPDARLGRDGFKIVSQARKVILSKLGRPGIDPRGVLPYWLYSIDSLLHATRKMAAFGIGGRCTPALRRWFKKDMTRLMKRFEKLWMARNRRSNISDNLKRYRATIRAL